MDDIARTRRSEDGRLRKPSTPFASETLFRDLIYSANDAYFVFAIFESNEISPFVEVNPIACKTTGFSRQKLLSMTFRDLVSNYITAAELRELEETIFTRSYTTMEWKHVVDDGRILPLELSIRVVPQQHEKIVFMIARDISERKEFENVMHRMAYFDDETGLPNRRKFRDDLNQCLVNGSATDSKSGVVFLNMDNFKQMVSMFGYSAAEGVVKSTARRLKACFPPNCFVARWGGDEFAVFIPEGDHRLQMELVNRVKAMFSQPFVVEGRQVFVTLSAGVAVYPRDGESADTLIQNASTALIEAKHIGKGRMVRYSGQLHGKVVEKLTLVSDLRRAVAKDEFCVHYQPEFEASTGRLVGIEALVRWNHPERGLIYPDAFIPVAEEAGIISHIGESVFRTACEQALKWEKMGFTDYRIAINLSVLQLTSADFITSVKRLLQDIGIQPDRVQFEITESVFMHIDKVSDILHNLHELGVTMAVDDFGTGFSSLSYLRRLPVHMLKIDKSFVRNLPESKNDWTIVKAIIELAHQLDLKVVAEGIETDAQRSTLLSLGCDFMQGFLFGAPVSHAEFSKKFIMKM